MTINQEYELILRDCVFISKPDEWFIEGFESQLDTLYTQYENGHKFNENSAIMEGLTYEGCPTGFFREDSEGCPLTEFEIYDRYGNEISELTLLEYKSIVRDNKIETIVE